MPGIRLIKWIMTLSLVVFLYGTALGQAVNNAQIHGLVQDTTGAAVSGAQVKATQLDTGRTQQTISGGDGAYTLPGLPIGGAYSIEVTASGFDPYKQSGIVLTVGSNVEVNIKVGIGTVSQQIQVNSDASMVQTQDTSISETIDTKQIGRAHV